MPLNLRQMEVLRAVFTVGNLTDAGKLLGVSQPAVSRMVKHIEARVGFPLFDRERGRLVPTPEASELAGEIERIFLNVENTRRVAHALRQGWSTVIRIGAMPTLANAFLPEAIATATRQQPNMKLVVKSLEPRQIEQGLLSGDFHLGLVQSRQRQPDIATLTLCTTEFVCVMPAGHPLAARTRIEPGDLAGERLISISELTPIGHQLDALFRQIGVERQVGVQTTSSALAWRLVAQGYGIAVVDPFALGQIDHGHLAVRPLDPSVQLEATLWHRRGRVLSRPEAALVAGLRLAVAEWGRSVASRIALALT